MKLPIHPPTSSTVPLENRVFSNKHEQIRRHRLFIPLKMCQKKERQLEAILLSSEQLSIPVIQKPGK